MSVVLHLTAIKISNYDQPKLAKLGLLLMKWARDLGLHKVPEDSEIDRMVKFIADNYPELSGEEINLAFTYVVSNKIKVNVEHYQNFAIAYVCKIINTYKEFKEQELKQYYLNKKYVENLQPKTHNQHNMTFLQYAAFLHRCYNEFLRDGYAPDTGNVLSNFLDREKKVTLQKYYDRNPGVDHKTLGKRALNDFYTRVKDSGRQLHEYYWENAVRV